MSNPTVSFRISNYQLARGLRAIRQIEPNWYLTSPANIIKTIFIDYIAKSEHFNDTPPVVSDELLQEIAFARENTNKQERYHEHFNHLPPLGKSFQMSREKLQKASQQREQAIEDERLFNQLRREAMEKPTKLSNPLTESQLNEIDTQIELAKQTDKRIMRVEPQEVKTDSIVTTVTDFSPPKDWTES